MPRLTEKQIRAALEATCGKVYLASQMLGCPAATIVERIRKSKALRELLEGFHGRLVDAAEAALYSAILAREPWAVRFALADQRRPEDPSRPGAAGPAFLEPCSQMSVQEVLAILTENDDYLDYCRSKLRPPPPTPSAPPSAASTEETHAAAPCASAIPSSTLEEK